MEHQTAPKVSVIIPVYNTAAYVRPAIESICRQTLQELEIIVVNDGSTDGSAAIIRELARADERIRVQEQENRGLSVSRNVGMGYATGRYIYFMDSDDLLEVDALERCYAKCEAEVLDFVFFDAETFHDNDATLALFNYKRTEKLREGVYTGLEMLNIQLELYQFTSSVCLNLIRREYLCKLSLRFHPGILHEDQLFSTLLYLQAQRVSFLRRTFFHRRVRKESIMTSRFAWRNMEGYLTVARELIRFGTSQTETVRQTIDQMLSQMLNAAVWQAHVLPLNERMKLLNICLKHYRRYVSKRTLATLLLKRALKQ